jgi:hypothetical protein
VSESVNITVAATSESVGVAVDSGESVSVAVSAQSEAVAITVQPESDFVALAVAETVEQVSLAVAPFGESVGVQIADQGDTVTLTVQEGGGDGGEAPLTWSYLVTQWDVTPALSATIAAGGVYAYTLDGVTRYRLVPSPYSPAGDAFYATFSGGVLSTLVAARG